MTSKAIQTAETTLTKHVLVIISMTACVSCIVHRRKQKLTVPYRLLPGQIPFEPPPAKSVSLLTLPTHVSKQAI